jgi:hypothetical protein
VTHRHRVVTSEASSGADPRVLSISEGALSYTDLMRSLALFVVISAVVGFALAGCGGSSGNTSAVADVTDVATVDDVRREFAAADGTPRLVLLLAPT